MLLATGKPGKLSSFLPARVSAMDSRCGAGIPKKHAAEPPKDNEVAQLIPQATHSNLPSQPEAPSRFQGLRGPHQSTSYSANSITQCVNQMKSGRRDALPDHIHQF